MPIPEFTDPRQAVIYDAVNSYGPGTQPDFYLGVAEEVGAETVVDLGCGTGIITLEFASRGYRMIGVEPSPVMLEVALQKPGVDGVQWVQGGAGQLGTPGADTGNHERPRSPVHLDRCRLAGGLGWGEGSAQAEGILGLREPRPASAGVEPLDRSQADNPGLPLRSNQVLDRGNKRGGRSRLRGRPPTSLREQ